MKKFNFCEDDFNIYHLVDTEMIHFQIGSKRDHEDDDTRKKKPKKNINWEERLDQTLDEGILKLLFTFDGTHETWFRLRAVNTKLKEIMEHPFTISNVKWVIKKQFWTKDSKEKTSDFLTLPKYFEYAKKVKIFLRGDDDNGKTMYLETFKHIHSLNIIGGGFTIKNFNNLVNLKINNPYEQEAKILFEDSKTPLLKNVKAVGSYFHFNAPELNLEQLVFIKTLADYEIYFRINSVNTLNLVNTGPFEDIGMFNINRIKNVNTNSRFSLYKQQKKYLDKKIIIHELKLVDFKTNKKKWWIRNSPVYDVDIEKVVILVDKNLSVLVPNMMLNTIHVMYLGEKKIGINIINDKDFQIINIEETKNDKALMTYFKKTISRYKSQVNDSISIDQKIETCNEDDHLFIGNLFHDIKDAYKNQKTENLPKYLYYDSFIIKQFKPLFNKIFSKIENTLVDEKTVQVLESHISQFESNKKSWEYYTFLKIKENLLKEDRNIILDDYKKTTYNLENAIQFLKQKRYTDFKRRMNVIDTYLRNEFGDEGLLSRLYKSNYK